MSLAALHPQSIYLTLSLLSLLTGGVLGLMHRGLMPDVQPAAVLWRIGTLCLALAGVFFAFRGELPLVPSVLVGNTLAMMGTVLYAHGVRRFFGLTMPVWPYLLVAIGVVTLAIFVIWYPHYRARVILASGIMATHMVTAAFWVYRRRDLDLEVSGRMMAGVLAACGVVMAIRAISAPFMDVPSPIAPGWVNVIGGLAGAVFPVVGTTAFLMMATDRSRIWLQRAAVTDELTGLPNRRALTSAARQGLAQIHGGGRMGLILFDIDRFKSINDSYGHDVGDKALAHIAAILRTSVASPAVGGRFGGEEFLCVLPGADGTKAAELAELLRSRLEVSPLKLPDRELNITASFGVSTVRPDDDSIDRALARADVALYRAKTDGRNRVAVHP